MTDVQMEKEDKMVPFVLITVFETRIQELEQELKGLPEHQHYGGYENPYKGGILEGRIQELKYVVKMMKQVFAEQTRERRNRMVFEDKRLGYGVYNPRIRKGAKGYYSNYLKSIVEKVGNPHRHPAILCRQLVEDPKTDANLLHPYIIYNPHTRENEGWQFFYVLEEAE